MFQKTLRKTPNKNFNYNSEEKRENITRRSVIFFIHNEKL